MYLQIAVPWGAQQCLLGRPLGNMRRWSFVTAAQSIAARNVSPLHPAVVSITHIAGGTTWNVLPGRVWMEGTIRLFDADDRALVKERIERLTEGIAAAFGGRACRGSLDGGTSCRRQYKEVARSCRGNSAGRGLRDRRCCSMDGRGGLRLLSRGDGNLLCLYRYGA